MLLTLFPMTLSMKAVHKFFHPVECSVHCVFCQLTRFAEEECCSARNPMTLTQGSKMERMTGLDLSFQFPVSPFGTDLELEDY